MGKSVEDITHSQGKCIERKDFINLYAIKNIHFSNNSNIKSTLQNSDFLARNFVNSIANPCKKTSLHAKAVKCAYCRKNRNSFSFTEVVVRSKKQKPRRSGVFLKVEADR